MPFHLSLTIKQNNTTINAIINLFTVFIFPPPLNFYQDNIKSLKLSYYHILTSFYKINIVVNIVNSSYKYYTIKILVIDKSP